MNKDSFHLNIDRFNVDENNYLSFIFTVDGKCDAKRNKKFDNLYVAEYDLSKQQIIDYYGVELELEDNEYIIVFSNLYMDFLCKINNKQYCHTYKRICC